MRQRRILVIFHEVATAEAIDSADWSRFGEGAYRSSSWSSRPNSTVRLNIVNLLALNRLRGEFDITLRTDKTWSENLPDIYSNFDVIVLNAISWPPSIEFARSLVQWKKNAFPDSSQAPVLILGTEVTWDSALRKGIIDAETYNSIYFDEILLRHTARTDRPIYKRSKGHLAAIQEFELGIDFSVLPDPAPVHERRYITVVRAPKGRATKNNSGIDALKSLISQSPTLSKYELVEFVPPYSVYDYWEKLASTAFMFFTSVGETFSYALNDAKALGVITLMPEEIFFTVINDQFAVDAYPETRIRYRSYEEGVQIASQIASDENWIKSESLQSYKSVHKNFSLARVTDNWRRVLGGVSLNTNSLFIYGKDYAHYSAVESSALAEGCAYALAFENRGYVAEGGLLATYHDHSRLTTLRYPYGKNKAGEWTKPVTFEAGAASAYAVPVPGDANIPFDEKTLRSYFQLLVRSYKISRIVVDKSLAGEQVSSVIKGLTYYAGSDRRRAVVRIEWK